MTYHVSAEDLTALGVDADGFAKLVQARIETLREYAVHEATVRVHARDETMKPEDRWVTLALPQAPIMVDVAINWNGLLIGDEPAVFKADYVIDPVPLDKRKAELVEQVNEAERTAINATLPRGKVRAYQYREADIRAADHQRFVEEFEKRKAAQDHTPIDADKLHRDNRPAADTKFLDEAAARETRLQRIYRCAADLHSEIEDLTEATVDTFEVKPFHG